MWVVQIKFGPTNTIPYLTFNRPATIAQICFSPAPPACANSHVQALLSFGSLVLGAVAHDGVAVRQVEVECDQRAVLQAQGPQCGAVNLCGEGGKVGESAEDSWNMVASWQTAKDIQFVFFIKTA